MRIIKNPEDRKREILEAAIHVFAKKGYDKTSISDIAAENGISQGLCYRYYSSKEEIYDAAIEEYANFIVRENLRHYHLEGKTLKELICSMSGRGMTEGSAEKGRPDLFELFHKAENRKLHDQLFLLVGQKLLPIVTGLLEAAAEGGEIQLSDLKAAAYFIVFGQIGILMDPSMDSDEKTQRIQNCLIELLKL
ncbi:TetR/AcrR family transcriptional regulator [Clostridium sp. AM58-1XD]|uniref:TetR/AcrR family transcriptional regulator n=1 Tax=Clostridium sp. AM58-1XD TaxID=2292307 RepID=UPI000E49BB19|nr:TetR/AcrR family transcriptional regulator [Clostridium sp. AM58-1XD]RGY99082.1 TetR/AcrR family transcriptional regulator [Clostridium sp. AM58-1XD]